MGSDVYGTFHEASIENKTKKNFSDFLSIYSTQILLRFVSFIIVKSPNLFSYIPKKHHGKCEIVPNGVDFECFKPMDRVEARKELGLPLQNKIILFLGDPKIKRKNFPMALQAIELVKNTYPDIQLISPYPVPHAFIPKYMNAANVLVLPSFEEGSPNVVKESLACNVPVVCTNVGDVEDHLSKLKNSFIVNFSPEELGRMIIATIELEDKNKEDSRSIISYLDRRLISKKIIQIYSQVLA
jgi:glycosyltransferase involved in cell wall biosynthesis